MSYIQGDSDTALLKKKVDFKNSGKILGSVFKRQKHIQKSKMTGVPFDNVLPNILPFYDYNCWKESNIMSTVMNYLNNFLV